MGRPWRTSCRTLSDGPTTPRGHHGPALLGLRQGPMLGPHQPQGPRGPHGPAPMGPLQGPSEIPATSGDPHGPALMGPPPDSIRKFHHPHGPSWAGLRGPLQGLTPGPYAPMGRPQNKAKLWNKRVHPFIGVFKATQTPAGHSHGPTTPQHIALPLPAQRGNHLQIFAPSWHTAPAPTAGKSGAQPLQHAVANAARHSLASFLRGDVRHFGFADTCEASATASL